MAYSDPIHALAETSRLARCAYLVLSHCHGMGPSCWQGRWWDRTSCRVDLPRAGAHRAGDRDPNGRPFKSSAWDGAQRLFAAKVAAPGSRAVSKVLAIPASEPSGLTTCEPQGPRSVEPWGQVLLKPGWSDQLAVNGQLWVTSSSFQLIFGGWTWHLKSKRFGSLEQNLGKGQSHPSTSKGLLGQGKGQGRCSWWAVAIIIDQEVGRISPKINRFQISQLSFGTWMNCATMEPPPTCRRRRCLGPRPRVGPRPGVGPGGSELCQRQVRKKWPHFSQVFGVFWWWSQSHKNMAFWEPNWSDHQCHEWNTWVDVPKTGMYRPTNMWIEANDTALAKLWQALVF